MDDAVVHLMLYGERILFVGSFDITFIHKTVHIYKCLWSFALFQSMLLSSSKPTTVNSDDHRHEVYRLLEDYKVDLSIKVSEQVCRSYLSQ